MSDIALTNAAAYAARYHLLLGERLGFGIHGTVHVAEHEGKQDQSAIKAFNLAQFYLRERAVYKRLHKRGVSEVLGFHVPQFLQAADDLQVIEMSIVAKPFVLDFAGAHLNARPEFDEEAWAEWEEQKREQFGRNWAVVQKVMDAFEAMGVYLVDISPSNIRFAD